MAIRRDSRCCCGMACVLMEHARRPHTILRPLARCSPATRRPTASRTRGAAQSTPAPARPGCV
eukprot:1699185-Lingulodinium_polyedra.AAC.1